LFLIFERSVQFDFTIRQNLILLIYSNKSILLNKNQDVSKSLTPAIKSMYTYSVLIKQKGYIVYEEIKY
ncbi:hypothetical protein, partial [Lactobacillus sp. UMNPBX6]|uniref:hypothetical protein n=1 Tax=Lactobacillus sp. UMNPBX6 TaxID=2042041 RepID=UPI000BEEC4A9